MKRLRRMWLMLLFITLVTSLSVTNLAPASAGLVEAGVSSRTVAAERPYEPPPDGWGKPPLAEGAPTTATNVVSVLPHTAPTSVGPTSVGPTAVDTVPTITVWYEDGLAFGQRGQPQQWVNSLGNVSGGTITALTYELNDSGSVLNLKRGADTRRLALAGDFNVELDTAALQQGVNSVEIKATNASGTATKVVSFTYNGGSVWPLPYVANWSATDNINDVAQVVDGDWIIDDQSNTLHPVALAYDRLVAIGDVTWTDYQVTVPMTVHGIDSGGFAFPSGGPGVGVILRWQPEGHYYEPNPSGPDFQQPPNIGWRKLGALGWYRWSTINTAGLQMIGYSFPPGTYPGGGNIIAVNNAVQMTNDEEFTLKMNVRTTDDGAVYRLRLWKSSLAEPADWHMVGTLDNNDDVGHPANGALLLVAHHVDVSFGNVTVEPLSQVRQTLATNVVGSGSVTVNPPGQTDYEFGSEVTLTAVPQPGYMFAGWGGDLSGASNPATVVMDGDKSVIAFFEEVGAPYSDNFNSCTLNNFWTFVDPLNDAGLALRGAQIALVVPGGVEHDVWTGKKNAPRLMQPAEDEDFEVEVKFDSAVSGSNAMQGILIEESAGKFVRFDFLSNSGGANVFAASFTGGSATTRIPAASVSPPPGADGWYLRVSRSGDQWTMRYSFDGESWTTAGSFSFVMSVTQAGIFAGNAGSNPAHTAVVDYFHNTGAPAPDDPLSTDPVTIVGQGNVAISPSSYACGDTLTLTASAANGWRFTGWSGAAAGSNPQTTISYGVGDPAVATFKQEFTLTVNSSGAGSVTPSPQKAVYLDGETVRLTATADPGWRFAGWSGAATGSNPVLDVVMNANKTITANFEEGYELYLPVVINGGP